MEQVKALFRDFDVDGSGALDKTEVRALFESLGHPLSEMQFELLLSEVGQNDDGRISYEALLDSLASAGAEPYLGKGASASSSCKERPAAAPRSLLHDVDLRLQTRGKAKTPGRVGAVIGRRSNATHVVRIALTGGPCAGKSSALDHIIAKAKAEGFDVYTAPETATLIFNSGFTLPSDPEGALAFQVSLARMQLAMERSLTKIAGATGRPSVLVFDRGLLDAKGYMSEHDWKRLLQEIGGGDGSAVCGVTESYLLSRYDAVIHLVTSADGAEKFYKWGKTTDDSGRVVIRGEPPEKARALDTKMQACWKDHDNHVVVPNLGTFEDKMQAVAAAVLRIAEQKHPQK
eukprot:TRINITY_DN101944_c0_g1_i1.p1 TRINITY_DN101944_c0_g1~~TRINITY_DN101944_c0_g1_i1.p1  ORF type:complete len:346 (+),score=31.48 TRINITY_DN101944_c0_g1_i1:133-1170(+)